MSTYVKRDASDSIGGALEYAGNAASAMQQRDTLTVGTVPPDQVQQQRAQQAIGGFVNDVKDSFMSAMRITSVVAGVIGLSALLPTFRFMPTRREHAAHTAPTRTGVDEPAVA